LQTLNHQLSTFNSSQLFIMRFTETKLKGAYIIEPEPIADERGFFARTFCAREFEAHGLNPRLAQCNISYNARRGTLRGMHYQAAPHQEAKLVRCTRGAIYDVIIDLRPGSPTFMQWLAVVLTALNSQPSTLNLQPPPLTPPAGSMLYIPEGFAHGFQTLEDETEVFYQMSEFYHPECARGVRWDDPAFGIVWPDTVSRIISVRDQGYVLFTSKEVL